MGSALTDGRRKTAKAKISIGISMSYIPKDIGQLFNK